jgi:hypothetical protein
MGVDGKFTRSWVRYSCGSTSCRRQVPGHDAVSIGRINGEYMHRVANPGARTGYGNQAGSFPISAANFSRYLTSESGS